MENKKHGLPLSDEVPYISTIENQKYKGKFGEFYVCVGIKGER